MRVKERLKLGLLITIWSLRFTWTTLKHKVYVFLGGCKIGVPIWRLIVHDLSKFSPAELPHYARWFFGDQENPEGFARAWLHHQNHNPHHWEYWMARTGHVQLDQKMEKPPPLPMPEVYVREMVADWMGASKFYTGSWDMREWLKKNLPRIMPNLHPETQKILNQVLIEYWIVSARTL